METGVGSGVCKPLAHRGSTESRHLQHVSATSIQRSCGWLSGGPLKIASACQPVAEPISGSELLIGALSFAKLLLHARRQPIIILSRGTGTGPDMTQIKDQNQVDEQHPKPTSRSWIPFLLLYLIFIAPFQSWSKKKEPSQSSATRSASANEAAN